LTILREKCAEITDFASKWREKYAKMHENACFDADFLEKTAEIAAKSMQKARLAVQFSENRAREIENLLACAEKFAQKMPKIGGETPKFAGKSPENDEKSPENGSEMLEIVANLGNLLVKRARFLDILAENAEICEISVGRDALGDPKLQISAEFAENGSKTAKNGSKTAKNGSKTAKNGAKTSKNESKSAQSAENGAEMPENAPFFAQISQISAECRANLRAFGEKYYEKMAEIGRIAPISPEKTAKSSKNASKSSKNAENNPKNTKNTGKTTEIGPKTTENGAFSPLHPKIPRDFGEFCNEIEEKSLGNIEKAAILPAKTAISALENALFRYENFSGPVLALSILQTAQFSRQKLQIPLENLQISDQKRAEIAEKARENAEKSVVSGFSAPEMREKLRFIVKNEAKRAENDRKSAENHAKRVILTAGSFLGAAERKIAKMAKTALFIAENGPKMTILARKSADFDGKRASVKEFAAKTGPNASKIAENGAKTAQNGAKTAQNASKSAENGAKTAENASKTRVWPPISGAGSIDPKGFAEWFFAGLGAEFSPQNDGKTAENDRKSAENDRKSAKSAKNRGAAGKNAAKNDENVPKTAVFAAFERTGAKISVPLAPKIEISAENAREIAEIAAIFAENRSENAENRSETAEKRAENVEKRPKSAKTGEKDAKRGGKDTKTGKMAENETENGLFEPFSEPEMLSLLFSESELPRNEANRGIMRAVCGLFCFLIIIIFCFLFAFFFPFPTDSTKKKKKKKMLSKWSFFGRSARFFFCFFPPVLRALFFVLFFVCFLFVFCLFFLIP
jgi:hypothetical protein